ncbi:hypothetical protein [Polymorphum gilvum]|uniref:Uncharacterized protein n=1 Tax=Polymorphum gilvum (strain LMG 25793 / CGMCC 1.9160 / SL003B-26A1) TaxID=991905 RepID=F2J302_POLGS|nr:hypothetical protein [Polymorphum gilvum]ADZ68872.1 hypothetical protein SL003B_0437 [Polymorphum gilvum SL003B-26A1]
MSRSVAILLAATLAAGGAAPARAAETSAYTKIDLDRCRLVEPAAEEGTFGGAWTCRGHQGIDVHVAEGDLRMFVSFGPGAPDEPAAMQTFPAFNTLNETLEWRLRGGRPFATILRWFLDNEAAGLRDEVLVVTQLVPGAVCHVAYVDARANARANDLARQAADDLAGLHDCSQPARVIGLPGVLNY